jgi:hypothetical protein
MPWGNQEGERAFGCRWSKEMGQQRNVLAKRNCKRLFGTTSIGRDSILPSWPHYAKNHFVGPSAITPSAKLYRKFLMECMNILQSLMRLPRRSFKNVRSFGEDSIIIDCHVDHQGRLRIPLGQGKGGDLFLSFWAAFWPLHGRASFGMYLPPPIPFCLPHCKAGYCT